LLPKILYTNLEMGCVKGARSRSHGETMSGVLISYGGNKTRNFARDQREKIRKGRLPAGKKKHSLV
jgi:hypothetical protein